MVTIKYIMEKDKLYKEADIMSDKEFLSNLQEQILKAEEWLDLIEEKLII